MPKSPEEMAQAMIANMKEKTGKTLPQWVKLAKGSKLDKHGAIVKWLKTEHDMTHGFANLVALETLRSSAAASTAADPVAAQYSGAKAELRTIYDELIARVGKFGRDIEVAPKKAYVSLRRNKQFAIIQPSTKTRVDVGINLKGKAPEGRLEKSGSFNAMVSHRVRLGAKSDVDKQLVGWLREAYDAS